jgi:hypothetical protein
VLKKQNKQYKKRQISTSSDDASCDLSLNDSTDECENDETTCIGCGEEYHQTKKKEDWIQCIHCKRWMHESCSKFENICELCAKILLKKK